MRSIPSLSFLVTVLLLVGPPPLTVAEESPEPAAAAPQVHDWRAAAASGRVESRSFAARADVTEATEATEATPADWNRVSRGDRLASHAEVRTGKRGRTTLTRRADVLMINPDSLVELPLAARNAEEAPVNQRSGSVLYEIDGSQTRGFQVVTPYLVAGVKGTVFLVTVTDRYAAVTVEEGVVEVGERASGRTVDVAAGETALVEAGPGGTMQVVHETTRSKRDRELSKETQRRARHEVERMRQALVERDLALVDLAGDPAMAPFFDVDETSGRLSLRTLSAAGPDGLLAGAEPNNERDLLDSLDELDDADERDPMTRVNSGVTKPADDGTGTTGGGKRQKLDPATTPDPN